MFVALLAALLATWHVVAPQAPAARGAELIRGGQARCTATSRASAFALAARTLPLSAQRSLSNRASEQRCSRFHLCAARQALHRRDHCSILHQVRSVCVAYHQRQDHGTLYVIVASERYVMM